MVNSNLPTLATTTSSAISNSPSPNAPLPTVIVPSEPSARPSLVTASRGQQLVGVLGSSSPTTPLPTQSSPTAIGGAAAMAENSSGGTPQLQQSGVSSPQQLGGDGDPVASSASLPPLSSFALTVTPTATPAVAPFSTSAAEDGSFPPAAAHGTLPAAAGGNSSPPQFDSDSAAISLLTATNDSPPPPAAANPAGSSSSAGSDVVSSILEFPTATTATPSVVDPAVLSVSSGVSSSPATVSASNLPTNLVAEIVATMPAFISKTPASILAIPKATTCGFPATKNPVQDKEEVPPITNPTIDESQSQKRRRVDEGSFSQGAHFDSSASVPKLAELVENHRPASLLNPPVLAEHIRSLAIPEDITWFDLKLGHELADISCFHEFSALQAGLVLNDCRQCAKEEVERLSGLLALSESDRASLKASLEEHDSLLLKLKAQNAVNDRRGLVIEKKTADLTREIEELMFVNTYVGGKRNKLKGKVEKLHICLLDTKDFYSALIGKYRLTIGSNLLEQNPNIDLSGVNDLDPQVIAKAFMEKMAKGLSVGE
ncbi:uncharacterized protein LOC126666597 isoform X2 [Mercurialis annua]|uniref:uncharacterized protein LOC126666597 isoform X2 n=1 Tax=Mercurialis annua TaxID=3986 RepID=UPI002160AB8B|nr:uncharacterized protein LOC126666597 isoform X2 [Mercurialis annua]